MEGIAHGWKPDKLKRPPSKKVAQDFVKADLRVDGGKVKRTKPSYS